MEGPGLACPEAFSVRISIRGRAGTLPGQGRSKELSGWTIAALIAGVWFWSRLIGFGEAAPAGPDAPQPSVSVSAGAGR